MEFQNAGIDISQIPRAEDVPLQPIHPTYLKVLKAQWALAWLVVVAIAAVFIYFSKNLHQPTWIALISLAILGGSLLNWVLIKRSFQRKAYAVREHDIMYQTGWLIQSLRICPFNRIQHCSVEVGLFERKYGLATLSVFTAGGNEADMKIPGLTTDAAADLRELITRKTGIDASTS
ncbi:MAG TPA: PH domain-containing protein [Chitinophagaceae bacterium]